MAKQAEAPCFPAIELTHQQPLKKDGKPTIFFTSIEIGACSQQLKDALIAKFSNGQLHVMMVEKEFRASKKLDGHLAVSDLDGRHLLLVLESE
uniref:Uncharacterized protein n=1 Tax=Kalanchoe fedtschenkoi TaxID=63787 RepID=A0A7N0TIV4_KALFE